MPCYQVQSVSVEFKAANATLLDRAIEDLGWARDWNVAKTFCRLSRGIELDLRNGKATIRPDQQHQLNELKRSYSRQAVLLAARQNVWQLKWDVTKSKGQFMKGAL